MIDSTNPRQLADNIRKLWDKFKSISGDLLPSRSTATTGQILKLTGENKTPAWADEYSYTPPAYSETETNTGQKWIDGKDIYCIALTGNVGEIAAQTSITIATIENINIISSWIGLKTAAYLFGQSNALRYALASGIVQIYNVPTTYSEADYICIIYYTKPDPVPGNAKGPEDEEEPEEKKTTKKKTTK